MASQEMSFRKLVARLGILALTLLPVDAEANFTAGQARDTFTRCLDTGLAKEGNTSAVLTCQDEELARLDRALNQAYSSIRARLSPKRARELVHLERGWISHRDAKCGPRANPAMDEMQAALSCRIAETGDQLIWLRRNYR